MLEGKKGEKEITLSNCQNKAENTECFTRGYMQIIYLVSSVCVCTCVFLLNRTCVVFLCDSAKFLQLTVMLWLCMGVYSHNAGSPSRRRVCVCTRAYTSVSFCKLARHVAGLNPIRVYCWHAATVLTWYACYSNLVVKNRWSLGWFSGEFTVLKPAWFHIPHSDTVVIISTVVFFPLLCRRGSWCHWR